MKDKYYNPKLIQQAMSQLSEYLAKNPLAATPLADYTAGLPEELREVYFRAARRLKWSVCKSQGKCYENGRLLWK